MLLVPACADDDGTTTSATATTAVTTTTAAPVEGFGWGAVGEGPFTIGISNGFAGAAWRSQMLDDLQTVFEEYKALGLVDELIVESGTVDIAEQTGQIRNLIAAGVDAILINPNSITALNPVIEEAIGQGILVVCIDQAVTADGVLNVVTDQYLWARESAEWLSARITEPSQVVTVEGIAGHPGNEDRVAAVFEVFDANPNIELVARGNGNWDQVLGQEVASTFLATYPDLAAIWTQDAMATGVLRAVLDSGRDPLPLVTGDPTAGYLRQWAALRDETGFESIAVVNPPGIAATGLRFIMELLQGGTIPYSKMEANEGAWTVGLPAPGQVTNENLDEWVAGVADLPDTYTLDGILTIEETRVFFAG
jgi:ribose transport system substrate-binding protein